MTTPIKTWQTIEETAVYLGMGKTTLYTLAREGKIPASRVGKRWVFDREQLDAWAQSSKPIETFFTSTEANIDENLQIREPQREAYQRVYEFFRAGGKEAIVQIPVGCGKSGLAAILPFGIANGRVLVITPNLTIKQGMLETLDISNRQKNFWRKRDVLKADDMVAGPYVSTLDTGNVSVCEKSHIVVTNVQQLATNPEKWLTKFSEDFFDLIIIDEAHHSAAESWKKVLERFKNAKVINMTATPFRSDNQDITGELVYRYPFKRATMNGYIKRVKASYVAPTELQFTAKGETKLYSLDEVLLMKEKDWFSKGIALSDVCNRSIVDNSLEKLEELRQTGTTHQLIAVACSVDHAKAVRSLYNERGYNADVIHSNLNPEEKESILRRLRSGELDCIVQVQMLGEGFDHPKLSVSAIFRPFRSLAPYIQFVGRILRVVVQNDPLHPDNYGHIVTHAGMNQDRRLREFELFETDDQRFWDEVLGGNEPPLPDGVASGQGRQRLSQTAVANYEIVESLIEEDLTNLDDQDLIKELEKKFETLGLDPALAKTVVLNQKRGSSFTKAAEPFSVIPQKEWNELKKRLSERVNWAANLLLNRLEIPRHGRKIVNLGIPATNDFIACITIINQRLKKQNSKPRDEWTIEEFKEAHDSLENIVNTLTRLYKVKLNDKT